MQFAILGPLKVVAATGREIAITRPRWRSVLAYLLLHPDRPVSIEQMTAALWGTRPPTTATTQIHAAISSTRRSFRQAGADGIIETTGGGYAISSSSASIDFIAFAGRVATARELATADPPAAAAHLRQALGLWRGQALDGVNGAFVAAARQRLTEERLAATERLAEMDIAQGSHAELIPVLTELADSHPLRESLARLLIEALYRSGRKADALATYARARESIRTELGLEPGTELRTLYMTIIHDEDSDLVTPPVQVATAPARQLPPASRSFTGREAELTHLLEKLACPVPGHRSRARVLLLHGTAGIGKSTLAIQVAHAAADAYPDGQLYIQGPVTPAEVIGRCLRGAGHPETAGPMSEAEAAALFRSLTAQRRILIVLDNLDDPAQAEPVIPANPGSAVIITSRSPLTLLGADAVVRLEPMSPAEAIALLSRCARRDLPGSDPWAAQIASYCDYLPLALSIAGARLAAEPELTTQRLAALLSDRRARLDWLELGGIGVRTSIRTGYDLIVSGTTAAHAVAASAFRALGLLPIPFAGASLVNAMTGAPGEVKADAALDRLARAQLVIPQGDGRYRMHDTVRLVAGECAEETMSKADQETALINGLDYLTACAVHADQLLRVHRPKRADGPPPFADIDTSGSGLATAADVGGWLDRELPNLLAAAETAARHGHRHALWLSQALAWALRKRGEFGYENVLALHAVRAAEHLQDETAIRVALLFLGRSELHLGRYGNAADAAERALAFAEKTGDPHAQLHAHNDLGLVFLLSGQPDAARDRFTTCKELASLTPEADWYNRITLHNLAHVELLAGNWEQAARLLSQSLRLRRAINDDAGIGTTLTVLGIVKVYLGLLDEAIPELTEAAEINRRTGSRLDRARGLAGLAIAHLWCGAAQQAASAGYESLAEAAATSDPNAEAMGHRVLAAVFASADTSRAGVHARRYTAITRLRPIAPEDLAIAGLLSRLPPVSPT
jgi:DNA-binding SARP family transcriptional activator/tetratricopeptide (TPR) repeat protein